MRTLSFCFSTDAHLVKPTVDCMQSLYQLHLALGSRKGGCNKVSEAWDIYPAMWVTDSELKCLGTNIRTGRVNSLPKKGSQIFIMFCAVSDSTIFLCKQRSTDSTDHLNFWQYHAALSIAADHIISNGTCSQNGHDLLWGLWFIVPPCPPPTWTALPSGSPWAAVILPWEKCGKLSVILDWRTP